MPPARRIRNVLPLVYALAVVIGSFVGIAGPVAIVGALLLAISYGVLSGRRPGHDDSVDPAEGREERRARRAERRGP